MRGVDLTISLRKDEAPKVFPVSVRVDKPTDPMVFFSPITYSKVSSVPLSSLIKLSFSR